MGKYVAKWNKLGQCIVIDENEAHLPHIKVRWYLAGMYESGCCAVLPGETETQAAHRAYGSRARKGDLSWSKVDLLDIAPSFSC